MATGTLTLAWLVLTASALPGDVWPLNQRSFEIPFRIEESRRADIKELLLFCSTDQGATWNQVAVSAPDKSGFRYFAPADGLYWFSVCVVDRHGKREPADIYKNPPGQKVLVDTLKPTLRITLAERSGEEVVVGWEIQEDYPELTSLKLEYRTPEAPPWLWTAATITPALVGQTRFRPSHPGPVSLRMQVMDQAGNVGTAQAEVPGTPGASGTALAGSPPLGMTSSPGSPAPPPSSATPFSSGATTSGLPSPPPPGPPLPGSSGTGSWERTGTVQPTALTQPEPRSPAERGLPSGPGANAAPAGNPGTENGTRWAATSETAPGMPRPPADASGARLPAGSAPPPRLTNSTEVALDYDARPGPSGIGKVELWMTTDEGRTWQPFAEDTDLKSPIVFSVPGDGLYGFTLVVYSRAGRSRKPPQSGEAPQMRVEVDTTPPDCKLAYPIADPRRRDALVIPYNVSDRNLPPNPVTLQWAEQPEGMWQDIATELGPSLRYTWIVPPNMPINVYLRLIARDNAGNLRTVQIREPVLIDLTEPEAQIIGLAGGGRKP